FSSRRRHTRSKRDWSSDVCSSDLGDDPGPAEPARAGPQGAHPARADRPLDPLVKLGPEQLQAAITGGPVRVVAGAGTGKTAVIEIGRASCRERGEKEGGEGGGNRD